MDTEGVDTEGVDTDGFDTNEIDTNEIDTDGFDTDEADPFEMIPDYAEVFNTYLPNNLPRELVSIIKDYTFNLEDVVHYHGLILCHYCGNIWDGNAQCNCWEYYEFEELLNET